MQGLTVTAITSAENCNLMQAEHQSGSPVQFKNRIKPRVYLKCITRSTMYEKAPFC